MEIAKNISLQPYNTFDVDVHADFFAEVKNEQDIYNLISNDIFADHPHLILGEGSNILFTKPYRGLVIKNALSGKKAIKKENNDIYIKAGAGENRHDFVMRTLGRGFVGAENLVLIPGTVGAAPVGNIGAYGKEVKDIIHQVEGIDLMTKKKKIRSNADCRFSYRDSIFKHELKDKVIITAVIFKLKKDHKEYIPDMQYNDIQDIIAKEERNPMTISAQDVARIIMKVRKGKLPDRKKIGTAGSFFKNPIVSKDHYEKLLIKYPELKGNQINNFEFWRQELQPELNPAFKLYAGQLIELSGFKGVSKGPVGTYPNHALIIVNNGGANGQEIIAFAQSIQKKVLELFGVTLEPEVVVL